MPLNSLRARFWAQTYNFVSDAIKILQICYFNIFPSDDSVVLKVITIYNKDTDTTEEVLLEELQVFKVCYFSTGMCLGKGGIVRCHSASLLLLLLQLLHRYRSETDQCQFVSFHVKVET